MNTEAKTIFHALLFDGFDELDFFGVFEALRMARFSVETRSLEKQEFVTAAHGTKIIPDGLFSLQERPDVLIVPGGGWLARSEKGAWAEVQRGRILDVVKASNTAGITLASVCTGSLILAHAGLLKDRNATTNSGAVKELIDLGAKYVIARVVDDGDIVTAGGITASLDLGLWLVERYASQEAAQAVSTGLEFESRGDVFR